MSAIFQFGEQHADYPVRVINEREARAGAGILLMLSMVAFMQAFLLGDFRPTQWVVMGFFADFFIRVVVNPRFSPSLVLGRWAVRQQIPEYVGAPQKRFAWALGLALASLMLYLVVFNNVRGPLNILTCAVCLLLLFFESAFGICIGCKIYNVFNRDKAQLCPGGVCALKDRAPIQRVSWPQSLALVVFLLAWWLAGQSLPLANGPVLHRMGLGPADAALDGKVSAQEAQRCQVPALAQQWGHADMWKRHNGCP